MKLVIDTDIFIDYFRSLRKARSYFESIGNSGDDVYFSAITEAELLSGKECSDEEKKRIIMDFLSQWTEIPVDNTVAQQGGEIRRKYEVELDDALIAATAQSRDALLITRNTSDFKKIKGLEMKKPY